MTNPFADDTVASLVAAALSEDCIDTDVTALALVPKTARGVAELVARADGVIAGLPLLDEGGPLLRRFPDVTVLVMVEEGASVRRGDVIARLTGPGRQLLGLERTALNFLQRLSGIATMTRTFVEAARGTSARIQETRKTCPGWRALDKYAVRIGGGLNHRMNLSDQVLIKENHLAFLERVPKGSAAILEGVARARAAVGPEVRVEVEVETLEQLDAALEAKADIIMLDDFSDEQIVEAVGRRNASKSDALLEVSGGVVLDRVARIAAFGVDRISVGALTHSVKAFDLAMDLTPEGGRA